MGRLLKSLCFCCLLLLPSTCSAFEITPTELGQLESNLSRLEILNSKSQQELRTLRQELKLSKDESEKLTVELRNLKAASMKQDDLLKSANISLEVYAKEQRKVKRQRTLAYGLSVMLALLVLV